MILSNWDEGTGAFWSHEHCKYSHSHSEEIVSIVFNFELCIHTDGFSFSNVFSKILIQTEKETQIFKTAEKST